MGTFTTGPFNGPDASHAWVTSVLNARLSPIAQHLALAIHGHKAGPDGITIAGVQQLTGWTKTTVRGALRELQSRGIVTGHAVACSYCSDWIDGTDCHSDHVVAKNLGGRDDESNRVPVCKSCNSRKSAKPFLVWLMTIGGAL